MKSIAILMLLIVAPAPQVSAACFDFPENSMPACGFESENEINQWTIHLGSIALTAAPIHSGTGAAYLTSMTSGSIEGVSVEMDCFPVSGSGGVGYGIYVFPVSGPISCFVTGSFCVDADCSGFCSSVTSSTYGIPVGEWTLIKMEAAPFSPGARFGISCESSTPFEVVADDGYWGEGMVPVSLQAFVVD